MNLSEKFRALEADNAPGQEVRQKDDDFKARMLGNIMSGAFVDFSHGDVDAFPPTPGSSKAWSDGFEKGGKQAYTEYRGEAQLRERLAARLGQFTGNAVSASNELIITPGTQGALFLALGATVTEGTKVAIVEPDYFANRKIVNFLGGIVVPIPLHYLGKPSENGPDLSRIEDAFKDGAKVFVFSTPNNPTGFVYSPEIIAAISELAFKYDVTLIVDQLYSRLLYSGEVYTHLCACEIRPENLITIMGPSKTESLSGFRLGVAFGTSWIIERMERLQAIVSLRAAGYNQAALDTWFSEPQGWMEKRIEEHEAIRDELLTIFRAADFPVATPQAGSYLFPQLPPLNVELHTFIKLLRYQANVIVTAGTEFKPSLTNSIRLNFSQDHAAAVAAAERIVKMVEIYRR
ncbi:pyridoxal phosphate-dependent aminotransferase [Photobacterium sp. ZSDE20]|uniref:Pyridoxal phosphate-dependent aminotransferase n=1 Tax=Photobacterium pectinilyticum TaxID=2906793 RepID=A0ABT1NAN5_9GAMM|nr:pyridoxal phosphate-dependent aminotransferase [Photobacterium sp. ZSDE20]MCQ1061197.1 pyridoxal phosphate-dependent aminotransferase [Photobacterium sp. ZSDE20]MDD1829564.1 pyridoxal phosphate-dependent aminotransferase [Photobacterium sp. ZSDE20]